MAEKQFDVPILMLAFRRPETTKKVFERVREIRPKELFIEVNGPRKGFPEDVSEVQKVKDIFKKIDWPCKVHKLYREWNIGCFKGISLSIDWFFSKVDKGIILEDDCVPTKDFFFFCKEMLQKYKNDERVMHIAGYNFQRGWRRENYSYYFSKYPYIWGWATWKRAWKKYDPQVKLSQLILNKKYLKDIFPNYFERRYVEGILRSFLSKKADTWDVQWVFTLLANNGLSIVPNKNLVENIGFEGHHTHTKPIDSYLSMKTDNLRSPLIHPPFVIQDRKSDKRYAFWMFRKSLEKNILLKSGLYKLFTAFLKHKK